MNFPLALALAPFLAASPAPGRSDLVKKLVSEPGCVAVVADAVAETARRELASELGRFLKEPLRVVSGNDGAADLAAAPGVLLIGDVPELRRLGARLPVRIEEGGRRFVAGGRRYEDPGDRLALIAPDPDAPGRPLVVIAGSQASEAAPRGVRALLFGNADFIITRAGRTIRRGRFETGGPDGFVRIDATTDDDVLARVDAYRAAAVEPASISTPLVTVRAPFDVSALAPFVREKERHLKEAFPEHTPAIELVLYRSAEEKAAVTGSSAFCEASRESAEKTARVTVHAVASPPDSGPAFWAGVEAEAAALRLPDGDAGVPEPIRVGFPIALAGTYRGESLDAVVARLRTQRRLLSLAEMRDRDAFRGASYFFAEPSAASYVRFLIQRRGEAAVRDLRDIPDVESEWLTSILATAPPPDPPARPAPKDIPFQRGVCLTHTYGIHSGYLSASAGDLVRQLHEKDGVDWVSITPFGFLRSGDCPLIEPRERTASSSAISLTEENDESLFAMTESAHRAPVKVALVPHLWLHDVWCGEIAMKSEADWKAFFASYRRFIFHYAEIARRAGADLFCVGKELVATTRAHPEEWRAIIADVRRIYPGPITYAANWGQEFETIPFFGDLDVVGLNCYYPLAPEGVEPTEDVMRGAAEAAARRAEVVSRRCGRPIVLTEVGFTVSPESVREPWKDPRGDGRVDEALQARAYRAILDAFYGKSWCAGLYWWKVFTDSAEGRRRPGGFTPFGRPAELVLREYYTKPRAAK